MPHNIIRLHFAPSNPGDLMSLLFLIPSIIGKGAEGMKIIKQEPGINPNTISISGTGKARNQALCGMPENFSHFLK